VTQDEAALRRAPAVALRVPRGALVPVALFLGAALISGFTILRGVDPFDEGLVLQAARRVSEGQTPYADFIWAYGPAYPYLLAGLSKVFGMSLIEWRILRVLADTGVALLTYLLVRRCVGPRAGVLAWVAAACAMAQPRSANPFAYALLPALGAVVVASGSRPLRSRVLWAAVLTAAAAAFRLDFAIYGFVAVVLVLGLGERRVRPAALYAGAAAGLVLLLFLPFAIAAGPDRLYDRLIGTSLRERDYWTLTFPLSYHGSITSGKGLKHLLDFYVPALLVAGLAIAAAGAAVRTARDRWAPALWSGLLGLGLGGLSYLLSRADEFHTAPLLVTLAVLLPLMAAWVPRAGVPGGRLLAAAAAVVFALLLAHGVLNRVSALARPPQLAEVHVAGAGGAEAPPAEARALEQVVALIHARVPPDRPIYVAPARADLVRFTNSMIYVLADRDNATDRDFGLLSQAGEQRHIVSQLERSRPRVIVRWTDPLATRREANLRGRPSGIHILDDWVARNYRLDRRLYHYDVLVPG
jgi:hypothetical protein